MNRFALVSLFALLSSGALAADSKEEALRDGELSVGVAQLQFLNTWLSFAPRYAIELAYERRLEDELEPLRIGLGLRGTTPSTFLPLPFDVFVRTRIAAKVGAWEPAAGPEFGITGWGRAPAQTPTVPGDWDVLQQQRLGAIYFSFGAAPLRFRFQRWSISALEVQLGTTFPTMGAAIRVGVGLLNVGYSL